MIKELGEVYELNVREDDSLRNYHERMLILLRQMHTIIDLLEFENTDLWHTFDEIIAKELFDIGNLEWVLEMAKLAHDMELPYRAFWGALVNIALLKHQEFPLYDNQTKDYSTSANIGEESSEKSTSLINLVFYIAKS